MSTAAFVCSFVLTFCGFSQIGFAAPTKDWITFTTVPTNINSASLTPMVHLRLIPGTPYNHRTSSQDVIPFYHHDAATKYYSCAVDYNHTVMYAFDFTRSQLVVLNNFDPLTNFLNVRDSIFHSGVSKDTVRIAVDWITGNVYWTDPLFSWIAIKSRNAGTDRGYTVVIEKDLDRPIALAVDPVNRLMFWSDVGQKVKIERASLTGSDRQIMVSSGLIFPVSFTVDTERLYWLDSVRYSVESATHQGKDRKLVTRYSGSQFFDVDIFRDVLLVTNVKVGSLLFLDKNTGIPVASSFTQANEFIYAVAMFSNETQPLGGVQDTCSNYGCTDVCVPTSSGPQCMCHEGAISDGIKTCTVETGANRRTLVVATDTHICLMNVLSLCTDALARDQNCFFSASSIPSITNKNIRHMDLDMHKGKVIFTIGDTIYEVDIADPNTFHAVFTAQNEITGISLDWRDSNIYWCMGMDDGSINVIHTNTMSTFELIGTNLINPRDLIILSLERQMFWISGQTGSYAIESASMDGSERMTLIQSRYLYEPKSLAVQSLTDSIAVYWIDAGVIKRFVIGGSDLETLVRGETAPQLLHVYKNYIVWTEDQISATLVKTTSKISSSQVHNTFTFGGSGRVKNIKVLDAAVQLFEKGVCDVDNGECEQICIPIGLTRQCRCEYGYTLQDNNKNCSSDPITDDFLFVTDFTHSKIYQFGLETDDVNALDTDKVVRPNGIVYNPLTQTLIWGDSASGRIHSIFINGTGYKTIYDTDLIGSNPSRFAIDYSTGNIYYTLRAKVDQGFTGIAVFKQDGTHRKLIQDGDNARAIALDPYEGILFWTDDARNSPSVRKAHMDGTGVSKIISTGIFWPNGLTIDYKDKTLYLSDGYFNTIQRCSYIGVCFTIYTDTDAHLQNIELLGNYLYYTAWANQNITKMNNHDKMDISRFVGNAELGRLDDLTLYSSSSDRYKVTSHCGIIGLQGGQGECSTFCLSTPTGYTCTCGDGDSLIQDGKTCGNHVSHSSTTVQTTSVHTVKDNTTGLVVGSIIGGVVVLLGVVICIYCIYTRHQAKRPPVPTSMPSHSNNAYLQENAINALRTTTSPPQRNDEHVYENGDPDAEYASIDVNLQTQPKYQSLHENRRPCRQDSTSSVSTVPSEYLRLSDANSMGFTTSIVQQQQQLDSPGQINNQRTIRYSIDLNNMGAVDFNTEGGVVESDYLRPVNSDCVPGQRVALGTNNL